MEYALINVIKCYQQLANTIRLTTYFCDKKYDFY